MLFTEYGPGGYDSKKKNKNLTDSHEVSPSWDDIRAQREPLLAAADVAVNRAEDASDKKAAVAWRAYRVALRSITTTFDAPDAVKWPPPPQGGDA